MGLRKQAMLSALSPQCSQSALHAEGVSKNPRLEGSPDLTFLFPSIYFHVLRDFVHRMLPPSAYPQWCPLLAEIVEAMIGLCNSHALLPLFRVSFLASLVSSGVCMNYLCSSFCLALSFFKARGVLYQDPKSQD